MSFFKKLFGGGGDSAPDVEPETYEGFTITPTPINEGPHFRISARIEKEVGGEIKSHTLIRADTLGELEAANAASIDKAKKMIDEQGEGIFR